MLYHLLSIHLAPFCSCINIDVCKQWKKIIFRGMIIFGDIRIMFLRNYSPSKSGAVSLLFPESFIDLSTKIPLKMPSMEPSPLIITTLLEIAVIILLRGGFAWYSTIRALITWWYHLNGRWFVLFSSRLMSSSSRLHPMPALLQWNCFWDQV